MSRHIWNENTNISFSSYEELRMAGTSPPVLFHSSLCKAQPHIQHGEKDIPYHSHTLVQELSQQSSLAGSHCPYLLAGKIWLSLQDQEQSLFHWYVFNHHQYQQHSIHLNLHVQRQGERFQCEQCCEVQTTSARVRYRIGDYF